MLKVIESPKTTLKIESIEKKGFGCEDIGCTGNKSYQKFSNDGLSSIKQFISQSVFCQGNSKADDSEMNNSNHSANSIHQIVSDIENNDLYERRSHSNSLKNYKFNNV